MRIASKSWLKDWLDIENSPFKQMGLIGLPLVFASTLFFSNVSQSIGSPDSKIDAALCQIFPAAICDDAARLSAEEERWLEYMKLHCTEGKMDTCLATAIKYLEVDLGEAHHLLIEACNLDDSKGCMFLAELMVKMKAGEIKGVTLTGDGTELSLIHDFYEKACYLQEGHACAVLASRYLEGRGVVKDVASSIDLARRSCDLRHPHGCVVLAFALLTRTGTKTNEAQSLLKSACHEASHISGCHGLALAHKRGDLPNMDPETLVEAHAKACELNSAESCRGAGEAYLVGDFVAPNAIRAKELPWMFVERS